MNIVISLLILVLSLLFQYPSTLGASPLEMPVIGRGYDAPSGQFYLGSGYWSSTKNIKIIKEGGKIEGIEELVKDSKTFENAIGLSLYVEAKKGLYNDRVSTEAQRILNEHDFSLYFFVGGHREQTYQLDSGPDGKMHLFSSDVKTLRKEIFDLWYKDGTDSAKITAKRYYKLLKGALGPTIVTRIQTRCNVARTYRFHTSTSTEQEKLSVAIGAKLGSIRGNALFNEFTKVDEGNTSISHSYFIDPYVQKEGDQSKLFVNVLSDPNSSIEKMTDGVQTALNSVNMKYAPIVDYDTEPLYSILSLPAELDPNGPDLEILLNYRKKRITQLYSDYLKLETCVKRLNDAKNIAITDAQKTAANNWIGEVRKVIGNIFKEASALYKEKDEDDKVLTLTKILNEEAKKRKINNTSIEPKELSGTGYPQTYHVPAGIPWNLLLNPNTTNLIKISWAEPGYSPRIYEYRPPGKDYYGYEYWPILHLQIPEAKLFENIHITMNGLHQHRFSVSDIVKILEDDNGNTNKEWKSVIFKNKKGDGFMAYKDWHEAVDFLASNPEWRDARIEENNIYQIEISLYGGETFKRILGKVKYKFNDHNHWVKSNLSPIVTNNKK